MEQCRLRCSLCPRGTVFDSKELRRRHLLEAHLGELVQRDLLCRHCNRPFLQRSSCVRHERACCQGGTERGPAGPWSRTHREEEEEEEEDSAACCASPLPSLGDFQSPAQDMEVDERDSVFWSDLHLVLLLCSFPKLSLFLASLPPSLPFSLPLSPSLPPFLLLSLPPSLPSLSF